MARKKKDDKLGGSVVGRIITVVLLILLIAGGYSLYTMFRSVDITAVNMVGLWKDIDGGKTAHWNLTVFKGSDVATDIEPFSEGVFKFEYCDRGSGTYYETDNVGKRQNEYSFDYVIYDRTDKHGNVVKVMRITKDEWGAEPFDFTITQVSQAQLKLMKGTNEFTSWTNENLF